VFLVHERGCEDLDRVDLVVGENRVDRVVDLGHAPQVGHACGLLLSRVADRDDVAAIVREVSGDIERRDVAGSDDSESDAFHGGDVSGARAAARTLEPEH
jgi:hypothetical protein